MGAYSPVQAEVIFVIESTAANGAFIGELKTNYILPTLEYFHGGPLEESGGCGSVYSIVTYKAADCHPSLPVSAHGPFQCPQGVVDAIDRLQFIGGHAENRACVTEALTTALACVGRNDVPIHIILVCCSPPYSAYAGGFPPPGAPATIELAARLVGERGAQLSVMSARRVPALVSLYEHAGGELLHAHQRNYAKDPRHLVLLRGYSLKERPPSPAPPPAPEIQADPYGQGRGAGRGAAFSRAPAPPPRAWLPPPPPRALYSNNSALLTQLAQPSYPPPAQAQSNMPQNMPRMPMMAQPSTSGPAPQRNYIWSGVLEWMEKGKAPGDQQKVTKHLPCQVSASSKDIEPELKVDTWPNKLLMQLMPKHLISSIGGQYLKDSKSVLFHLQPNEALDALTKVLVNGFAGCVHFSPMSSPPQCDIKVLILLYTPEKKAYLGFIPNNQGTFVDRLRKVIQQQKITQIINKQLPPSTGAGAMQPNMATNTMAGTAGMSSGGMSSSGMPNPCMSNPGMLNPGMSNSGMPNPGMSNPGMPNSGMSNPGMQNPGMPNSGMSNPGMPNPGMSNPGVSGGGMSGMPGNLPGSQPMGQPSMQQHNQSMMMSGQTGGPRATQLDGLEAARQQNLEKIQQLQQTLEAAHQQDAMFKSQMDIMSHLQAAQQQEQHYKMQMEEKQRQHQLQQQLQQQLRGNAAPNSRMMRPLLPSNPGLRHLLQQQPQYRPGGGPVRPTTQSQQFDDVNSYNDFL